MCKRLHIKMFKYEWIWKKNAGSNFATVKYQPMKEHENILVFADGKTTYNPIMQERSELGKSRVKYQINSCTNTEVYNQDVENKSLKNHSYTAFRTQSSSKCAVFQSRKRVTPHSKTCCIA